MRPDDHVMQAIEIGKRNAEVVPLIENWCAHARIVIEGGVGLVEQQTGLPIGMRRVACAHERAAGQISMHLAENALDFHDRNCATCTQRMPVRLPNLTQLLRARDERRAASTIVAEEHARLATSALAQRAAQVTREKESVELGVRDGTVSEASAYAVMSVLDQLIEFDANPSDATAVTLGESARAVPQAFTPAVAGLAAAIGNAGGDRRASAMLELLGVIAPESRGLWELALHALARDEASDLAALHIERLAPTQARSNDDPLIAQVAPMAIWRARAFRHIGESEQPARPDAYIALYRAAPQVMEKGTRLALRSNVKQIRRAGAFVVHALITCGDTVAALKHVPDLIAGFSLPDDYYEEGEAGHAIAWVLSELLRARPAEVQPALQRAQAQGDSRARLGVVRAYMAVFDEYDDDGHRQPRTTQLVAGDESSGGEVTRLAFRQIIDSLSRLSNDDDCLREAAEFIADRRGRIPSELTADAAPALLGVVAIAVADEQHGAEPKLEDPRPIELQNLERMARRSLLDNVVSKVLGAVVDLACDHPSPETRTDTVSAILEMLQQLPETAEHLRAKLVSILGRIAKEATTAARVIPAVYTAMASRSNLIRARSAGAYADLSKQIGAENLPALLHESFLVLLSDPFIIVHDAALHVLDGIDVPSEYRPRVRQSVFQIVAAHREGTRGSTLATAISVLLRLMREVGGAPEKMKAAVISLIAKLKPYEADDFVRRNRAGLRGAAGYNELVLELLGNPGTFETAYDELLQELALMMPEETNRLADSIVATATILMSREYWRVLACLRVLTNAGALEHAARLAKLAIAACGTTRDKYPRRLGMECIEAAIMLESAATRGDLPELSEAVRRFRETERAISVDRAENKDLRGFRLPF